MDRQDRTTGTLTQNSFGTRSDLEKYYGDPTRYYEDQLDFEKAKWGDYQAQRKLTQQEQQRKMQEYQRAQRMRTAGSAAAKLGGALVDNFYFRPKEQDEYEAALSDEALEVERNAAAGRMGDYAETQYDRRDRDFRQPQQQRAWASRGRSDWGRMNLLGGR